MSQYSSHTAKWDAYQFSDPFAANAFVAANKKNGVVCRPSCDHYPKVIAKEDVTFLDSAQQAVSVGFKPCSQCSPLSSSADLNIDLIRSTIESINYSIGFTQESSDIKKRAFSTPSVNTTDGHLNERQLTRNESEHVKLVELACRHISAAAAENITKEPEEPAGGNKKKRRGGVLGFKELASKSKLSPWHFHRVFKSVTGLTPKSYGDQCWKHMKAIEHRVRERPSLGTNKRSHFRSNSDITNNYHSKKRVKREETIAPTAPAPAPVSATAPGADAYPSAASTATPSNAPSIDLTPVMPQNDILSLSNSLDINVAPMRHHSLDLGVVGLDSLDMGSVLNFSPEIVPVSQPPSNNNEFKMTDFNLQVPNMTPSQVDLTQFEPDRSSLLNTTTKTTNTTSNAPSTSATISTTANTPQARTTVNNSSPESWSLLPSEETQWPNIQTETTPQHVLDTNTLLTPPSSSTDLGDGSLYNTLTNNSPLDGDLFMNPQVSTTSGGAYELMSFDMSDPAMIFAGDAEPHDSLLDVKNGVAGLGETNLMV